MSDENGILKNCTAYGRSIQRCWTACWSYLTPQRCFSAIWYLLMLVVGIEAFQRLAERNPQGIWNWVQTVAAGAIVFLLFVFVRQLFRTSGGKRRQGAEADQQETAVSANSGAYPSPDTKFVLFILLAITAFSLVGLFLALNPPNWPSWLSWLTKFFNITPDRATVVNEALVMLFGAGIGSSVQTIGSFTTHSANEKDFDRAFIPWYVTRPLKGMLLGLIFYCLIKGGLLAVQFAENPNQNLNDYSLAGIGALVGLFSHRALDKLGEVFEIVFRTDNDRQKQLAMITGETKDKLISALPGELRTKVLFGTADEVTTALKALPAVEKKALLEKLPASVKPLFEGDLQLEPGDELFESIQGLEQGDKTKLLEQLPPEAAVLLLDKDGKRLDDWLNTKLDDATREKLRELPQTVKKILERYLKPPEPGETKPETNPPPEPETAES